MEVWVQTRPRLCPSYASQIGLFFMSLVVEYLSASVQLLSETVALCVVVALVCLQEVVSSRPSYSAPLLWLVPEHFSFLISLFFPAHNAAAAKTLHSCPTLCDPIDSSPPGFPIPGILQVRTLEWVPISFSNA